MSIQEKIDDDDNPFLALMTETRPLKTSPRSSGGTVSRRSNAPLMINLRRQVDDVLADAHRARPPSVSAQQVDARTARRVRQGKMPIEDRLDLHGFRYDAARLALRRFVAQAVERDYRCVLVVTGKGDVGLDAVGQTPARGVIRRSLPGWLQETPLDHFVLRCETAKPEDGGVGAVYLYLRRRR